MKADVTEGKEPRPVLVASAIPDFEYHAWPILPEGLEENSTGGCECADKCLSGRCSCIQAHGCFYDDAQRVEVEVRPTSKGLGLFATSVIEKGSFVCLYAGEILSSSEARHRWQDRKSKGAGNYVLVVKEAFGDDVLRTIIDPTRRGNVGRFINHACPPKANVVVLPIRPIGHVVPLAAMFAANGIAPGDELAFDYAGGASPSAHGNAEGIRTRCLCGSAACRGWMPFDATL